MSKVSRIHRHALARERGSVAVTGAREIAELLKQRSDAGNLLLGFFCQRRRMAALAIIEPDCGELVWLRGLIVTSLVLGAGLNVWSRAMVRFDTKAQRSR